MSPSRVGPLSFVLHMRAYQTPWPRTGNSADRMHIEPAIMGAMNVHHREAKVLKRIMRAIGPECANVGKKHKTLRRPVVSFFFFVLLMWLRS